MVLNAAGPTPTAMVPVADRPLAPCEAGAFGPAVAREVMMDAVAGRVVILLGSSEGAVVDAEALTTSMETGPGCEGGDLCQRWAGAG